MENEETKIDQIRTDYALKNRQKPGEQEKRF